MRLVTGSAVGLFSKGNEYSLSLNFGVSGGKHCDDSCIHHPESSTEGAPKDCYAVRTEKRHDRAALAAKLERHEALPPSMVIGKAILELQDLLRRGKRIDWLRLCTNGSLPQWDGPGCTALFKAQLKALVAMCNQNGIKLHIPVESKLKAEGYRQLLGDTAVVRESIQNASEFIAAEGAVSTSVGAGLSLRDRVTLGRVTARLRRRETGRKVVLCPAVTTSFFAKLERDPEKKEVRRAIANRAKCGTCDACSNPAIDVIYPAH